MRAAAAARAILVGGLIAAALVVSTALPSWISPDTRGGSQADRAADLSLTVATDTSLASAGQSVSITIAVRNLGLQLTWLAFSSSCRASFTVSDSKGLAVYNQSLHDTCILRESTLPLGPGEAATFGFVWDQTQDDGRAVPAGRSYRIDAVLRTSDESSRLAAGTVLAIEPAAAGTALSFSVRLDRDEYAPGDLANVTVVLTNNGTTTVDVYVPDTCVFAFFVFDRYGSIVFSIPFDINCAMIISRFTLIPGASHEERLRYDFRTSNGAYLAPGWYGVYPTLLHADVNPDDVTDLQLAFFFMNL